MKGYLDNEISLGAPSVEAPPGNKINYDIPGTLTKTIGTGKHAQASLVYYAIVYSFLIGLILSLLAYWLIVWSFTNNDFVDMLKAIWGVFMPLITLALGYIFGKNE